MPSNVSVRVPPTVVAGGVRTGRSKSDAKLVQRLQDEIAEGRVQQRRLGDHVDALQQKLTLVAAGKKESALSKPRRCGLCVRATRGAARAHH